LCIIAALLRPCFRISRQLFDLRQDWFGESVAFAVSVLPAFAQLASADYPFGHFSALLSLDRYILRF
jgi:hypothetical protein